jgi:hypothetical protein
MDIQSEPEKPTTPPKAAATVAPTTIATRKRRSARVLEHDPIIAPGFGTHKDIVKLTKELSSNNTNSSSSSLPVAAVEAMMQSRGRGIRSSKKEEPAAAAAAPASTAWADFMAEEGVGATATVRPTGTASGTAGGTPGASGAGQSEPPASESKKRKSAPTSEAGGQRVYELPIDNADNLRDKAAADSTEKIGGVLLQTGTLDNATVGRAKLKLTDQPYHLSVPTRILPDVAVTRVFSSCNAVHSIAIDATGAAWGWGRNEASQLGAALPAEVVMPTKLELPAGGKLVSAAIGKSHTMFLMEDGSVWGVGANKAGQCGVKSSVDTIPNYKKCPIPDDVTIIQVCIDNYCDDIAPLVRMERR